MTALYQLASASIDNGKSYSTDRFYSPKKRQRVADLNLSNVAYAQLFINDSYMSYLPNSMTALYQLASALGKTDEETKKDY
jgi:hypothetical protein